MKLNDSVSASELGPIADAIVSSSFDSVMVCDAADKTPIVFVNRAFSELTGYSFEEVKGKSPSLLQGPDTDPAVIDRLRKDLQSGNCFEGRAINYCKDGTPFTMHWRVTPVQSDDCKVRHFIAVQRKG